MPGSVIVSSARTPIGKLSGALASLSAMDLGGLAIKSALERGGVGPEQVDYVVMGQVLQAGQGQITARQAAANAGIPMTVPAITINKVCLSGVNAIYLADQMIQAGDAEVVVCGGMESMTNAPYLLPQARAGYGMGNGEVVDSLINDGLWCAFDAIHMGSGTENYVGNFGGLTRELQDELAAKSHERAANAAKEGRFAEEIAPVSIPQRKGEPILVETDEGVRPGTTTESLGGLRPAFDKEGSITAGNASQISDGGAALVVTSPAKAEELGLTPIAELVSFGMVAGPDTSLLTQPSRAIKRALEPIDKTVADLDLFELNEAFAAVGLASMKDLGISDDVVNVNGGAIALGHPIGMSGARIVITLVNELRRRGGGLGAAALCGGGGQGDAAIVRGKHSARHAVCFSVKSGRARQLLGLTAVGALVLVAGCRPEVTFDTDGRQSQIDRVEVTAAVRPDGIVHVEQRYTFASDDGGTVGVPDLADLTGAIPGAANVTLDGQPAIPSGGAFNAELTVDAKRGTVGYDLTGAVKRNLDAAVAELDVLPAPEDTSRQDPNVALSGTLTLPEGALPFVEAHLHGGRDREVVVEGSVVRFSMEAPIWQPFHKLAVAFPSDLVPGVAVTPIPGLPTFQTTQQIQDQADVTTEDVLADLDDQEDIGRWVLTAVAFGLPAIFWTIVAVGLIRRLRERRKVVADVPATSSDPPTDDDPAVVAVLDGEGRPAKEAVAGTILAMAHRKELEIQQYGAKVVVKVPLTTTAQNPSEQLVLDALREAATDQGVVEGPPVVPTSNRWWRAFRRDAVRRARQQGFVTRWLPLAPLSGAIVTTAVGIGIFFLDQPAVYAAIVIGTEMIAWAVSFVSGYTLTNKGWRQRAIWRSFGRYIHQQGKLDKDVGPAGVVVWGPYLVYGAALGEAHGASKPLSP